VANQLLLVNTILALALNVALMIVEKIIVRVALAHRQLPAVMLRLIAWKAALAGLMLLMPAALVMTLAAERYAPVVPGATRLVLAR